METERIIEELNEVLQIDIDAVGAYQAAIDAIDEAAIKNELSRFKADHERHITELKGFILRAGGDPEERPDLRGMARKAMTKVAGMVGTEEALRAMLSNEKLTNQVYERHCQENFPPDILDVLQRNYGDEQRHYAWIDAALRQRLWEHPTAPISP